MIYIYDLLLERGLSALYWGEVDNQILNREQSICQGLSIKILECL